MPLLPVKSSQVESSLLLRVAQPLARRGAERGGLTSRITYHYPHTSQQPSHTLAWLASSARCGPFVSGARLPRPPLPHCHCCRCHRCRCCCHCCCPPHCPWCSGHRAARHDTPAGITHTSPHTQQSRFMTALTTTPPSLATRDATLSTAVGPLPLARRPAAATGLATRAGCRARPAGRPPPRPCRRRLGAAAAAVRPSSILTGGSSSSVRSMVRACRLPASCSAGRRAAGDRIWGGVVAVRGSGFVLGLTYSQSPVSQS